ncbi:hypothetical protein COMA2_120134 [Candidatus Nitrospira nitrificans]|uniref:Uncharacterized protein n=1 Tax=Candidatus Nitrospira nitrificans TaxID=1742973 RepID=A0A0S4L8T2_9BACT|nr:hypothetical protein COMA2_120134 [Candidatus Nitrospira nitrificans]
MELAQQPVQAKLFPIGLSPDFVLHHKNKTLHSLLHPICYLEKSTITIVVT